MSDETKTQLLNLYAQKGELSTELEIIQQQLQQINRQIIQMRNFLIREETLQKQENS